MAVFFNLSGYWVGHYVQHDQGHGIVADLYHRGGVPDRYDDGQRYGDGAFDLRGSGPGGVFNG
jgi:hypothetical protein